MSRQQSFRHMSALAISEYIFLLVFAIVLVPGCSQPTDTEPVEKHTINAVGGTENPDRRGDVVFIHGLGGDYLTTWRFDENPQSYWPAWLAEDYPDIGVWSVNYEANVLEWFGGAMPIEERARNLLDAMRLERIGEKPVVFIVHSLGGLVTKKMLELAISRHLEDWEGIKGNTKGVMFLATPHTGSDKTTLRKYFESIAKIARVSIQVEQLDRDHPMLLDLDDWYRQNANRNNIITRAYVENEPLGSLGIIVSASSANPGIEGVQAIKIDANHVTICKPRTKKDQIYKAAAEFVKEALLPIPENIDISFTSFVLDFSTVRDDPVALSNFKKEYAGKRVRWMAHIQKVQPDDKEPYWMVSHSTQALQREYVLALFPPSEFNSAIPLGKKVMISGTIGAGTNQGGIILEDCKMIERIEKQ